MVVATVVILTSCGRAEGTPAPRTAADSLREDSIARARQDSINRVQPGYIVDSILPLDEEMRRFSESIGGAHVTALRHGSQSRDQVVSRFVKALAANDSTELHDMVLSAREFADLVFPSSPYTHPPYRESPARIWMLINEPSESGLTRLLRRLGGKPLDYIDHRCDAKPDRQGPNTIWTGCTLRIRETDGSISTHRYFGSIIERDGRYKIVSYRNEF